MEPLPKMAMSPPASFNQAVSSIRSPAKQRELTQVVSFKLRDATSFVALSSSRAVQADRESADSSSATWPQNALEQLVSSRGRRAKYRSDKCHDATEIAAGS